jgi:hypothetical protein
LEATVGASSALAAAGFSSLSAERKEDMIAAYTAYGGFAEPNMNSFSTAHNFDDIYQVSPSGQKLALLARYDGGGRATKTGD